MLFPRLAAYGDWGLLALRVAVGVIFVVHGWAKLARAAGMAESLDQADPARLAFVASHGAVETLGGLAMIAGLLVQLVAIAFAIIMVGAIIVKNTAMPTGFVGQNTTGWEFDFILLAANLALLVHGPGRLALMMRAAPERPQ